ncbi:MAG: hypothetical protein GF355_12005 [Candidatus Eisenbacteria bacterium]|nr:hypothetical protein [Candidatus Eisenbacteria bacterium]
MLVAHYALEAGRAAWSAPADEVLSILNTLAGVPFVLAKIGAARLLASSHRRRGLILLAWLGLGAVELFCGYVEVYSWALAVVCLYLVAVLRSSRGASPWPAVVLFCLAAVLHAVSILFIAPLLLVLLARAMPAVARSLEDPPQTAVRGAAAALLLGAACAPYLAAGLVHAYSSPRPADLTLLDPRFWWERLNGFLLASPVGVLAGLPLLAAAAMNGRLRRPEQTVMAAAALPAVLALALMKTVLGAADWDILAFTGPPLVLWAAAWAPELHLDTPAAGARRPLAAALCVALALSLANTWSFVIVQHGTVSIERTRDIVLDDPAPYYRTHPPLLHLAFLFHSNGLPEERLEALQQAVTAHPRDPRMPYNLAAVHFERDNLEEAEDWSRRALELRPRYPAPLYLLFLIAERRGDARLMVEAGGALLAAHAEDPRMVERYIPPHRMARLRSAVERARAHLDGSR